MITINLIIIHEEGIMNYKNKKRNMEKAVRGRGVIFAIAFACTYLFGGGIAVASSFNLAEQQFKAEQIHQRQVASLTTRPLQQETAVPFVTEEVTNGTAVFVRNIVLEGAQGFYVNLKPILEKYTNRRLTMVDIRQLVRGLQQEAVREGRLTGRFFIPEQSVGKGTLRLLYIPGKIRSFAYAPGSVKGNWRTAFPSRPGDVLDLRMMEQGADQIRCVPGQQVQLKIQPVKGTDTSDVILYFTRPKPLAFAFVVNNQGNDAAGKYRGRLHVTWANPLRLNDVLSVQIGREEPHAGRYQNYRQTGWSYTLPYGKYRFGYRESRLQTVRPIAAHLGTYPYRNRARTQILETERLWWRNQREKMTVQASVERYRGRNYIGASELRVQRTDRTSLRLGLDYNRYYSDGQINVLAAVSKGVPWWRDRVVKEYPGGPDIDAWVGNADISYTRSLKWQGLPVKYRVLWHGQLAKSRLLGHDEISIGGLYTVRGFSGANVLAGSSGWHCQQEWTSKIGRWQPFVGADIGAVYRKGERTPGHVLMGAAVGVKISGDRCFGTVTFSTPLIRPHSWTGNRQIVDVELGYRW